MLSAKVNLLVLSRDGGLWGVEGLEGVEGYYHESAVTQTSEQDRDIVDRVI